MITQEFFRAQNDATQNASDGGSPRWRVETTGEQKR